MTPLRTQLGLSAIAVFTIACADATGPLGRTLVPTSAFPLITDNIAYPFSGIGDGDVVLCKSSNVYGTTAFSVSVNGGPAFPVNVTVNAQTGSIACTTVFTSPVLNAAAPDQVVVTEPAMPANWILASINTIRYLVPAIYNNGPAPGAYTAPRLSDTESLADRRATVFINSDMARRVTFTNTFTPPFCDFITFGRLVWEHNGMKVVISGNAGGFNADGSIKGEFHIEVNGVDHHVHDVSTYGPIGAAPLASATYENSRVVTGTDIHGHAVELRLWDGGEPGWKYDRFWFNVNGTVVGNGTTGNLIDQGNMQYHANCRGPDLPE